MAGVGRVLAALESLRSVPTIRATACTREHGASCTACATACPVQSIFVGPGHQPPRVDAVTCIGCGLCVPVCLVGAVQGVGPSPARITAAARAVGAVGGVLEIRCALARKTQAPLGDGVYTADVSCLGALRPETVAAAAGHLESGGRGEDGGRSLHLVRAECQQCPVGASTQVDSTVEAGLALARRVAPSVHASLELRGAPPLGRPGGLDAPQRRAPGHARVGHDAADTASPGPGVAGSPLAGAQGVLSRDPVVVSRRAFLGGRSAALESTPPRNGGDGAMGAEPPAAAHGAPHEELRAVAPWAPLPGPVVSEACTGCQACVRSCPAGALGGAEWPGGTVMSLDPLACTGCAECVRVCPEQAVALACDLQPGPGTPRVLARVRHRRCERCDAWLGPGESQRCTRCDSHDAIAADVWRQYGL